MAPSMCLVWHCRVLEQCSKTAQALGPVLIKDFDVHDWGGFLMQLEEAIVFEVIIRSFICTQVS